MLVKGKFPKKLRIVVGYPIGQNSYYYNNQRIQKGEALDILITKLCEADSKMNIHNNPEFKIENETKVNID